MKLFFVPFVAVAFLHLPVCFAQSQEWTLDGSHSSINFAVDHMVISETTGKFDRFEVAVKADRPDFVDAKFNATVHANSINTFDAKRDEHLKAPDFFDVQKYPTITLEGKKFERQKNGQYKVYGKLTLHGVTKDVVWDAKFNGIVKDPWGGTRAGLKVTTVIDRYDYGLKYNSVLESGGVAVGQEVRVSANFELVKKQI